MQSPALSRHLSCRIHTRWKAFASPLPARQWLAISRSQLHLRPSPLIRQASTTASEVATDARSLVTRLKNLFLGTSIVLFLGFGYLYITDTRSSAHEYLIVPALRLIYPDPEEAHQRGIDILKSLHSLGLHPRERGRPENDSSLQISVLGHVLDNPIGTSAGIIKNGEAPSALLALGPAIVEVGGVTPLPQEGNPKPRVFRIPSQNALINRYGLNSEGAKAVANRLRARVRAYAQKLGLGVGEDAEQYVLNGHAGVPPGSLEPGKLMAVQIAKNKTTPDDDLDAVEDDHVYCVYHLGKYADILVVNVSSPNTPGLRSLQRVEPLTRILSGVVDAAKLIDRAVPPAVMVKVSPDEDADDQIAGICEAVHASGVDGVIVGNTTKKRPAPIPAGYVLPADESRVLLEQGGYSGPQMFSRTLDLVKRYRRRLDDTQPPQGSGADGNPPKQKVIFATGGITNGRQALDVLEAGASVAMVYTAMVYSGVGTISRIKGEMRDELAKRRQ